MNRLFIRVAASLLLVLFWAAGASALDYRDYIGFTHLKTELGSATPTGAGVVVSQVEAGSKSGGVDYYLPFLPGSIDPEFTGKTIHETLTPAGVSGHATTIRAIPSRRVLVLSVVKYCAGMGLVAARM